jgi:hypothetical protein
VANKFTDAVSEIVLPATQKIVLWVLAQFSNNDTGVCWPGQTLIARLAGLSYSTVQRSIDKLIEHGLISVTGEHQVRHSTAMFTHEYTLNLEKIKSLSLYAERTVVPEPGCGANTVQSATSAGSEEPTVLVAESANTGSGVTDKLNINSSQNSSEQLEAKLSAQAEQVDTDETETDNLSDEVLELCKVLSGHSGLKFKPDWYGYAQECLSEHPLDVYRELLSWIFTVQISDKKFRWADRTRNMKNLSDHIKAGALFNQWTDYCTTLKEVNQKTSPVPSTPAAEVCEGGGLHEWQEYTHTTDRCSECGTFRTNPVVTQWAAEDDLEVEYMELVEFYDPYWTGTEEPMPTAAYRPMLSASEFARATGAVAHWN